MGQKNTQCKTKTKQTNKTMMFTAVEVKGDCYWLTEETNVSETKMGNTLHQ